MHNPFSVAAERIVTRLLRHRERYIKAWVAATGLHPAQLLLEERTYPCDDGVIKSEVRIVPVDDAVSRAYEAGVEQGKREAVSELTRGGCADSDE